MLLLLYLILVLLIWIGLNEKDFKIYRRKNDNIIRSLKRRIRCLEGNQNNVFDYINDIYSDLEVLDYEKKK